MLHCTKCSGSPSLANSSAQNVRAKKPRGSAFRSISISTAPGMSSALNRMSAPAQGRIELLRGLEVLQLLQTRERPELIGSGGHLDALVYLAQLPRAVTRGATALIPGELPMNPVEVDSVAAIVAAALADAELAAGELLGHDLRQLAHAKVLLRVADIEYLAAYGRRGRDQGAIDGFADVIHVHDRPPGTAIARHGDPLHRVRHGAQVVQYD